MLPLSAFGAGVLPGLVAGAVAWGGLVAAASVVRVLRRRSRVFGGSPAAARRAFSCCPGVPGVQDALVAGDEQHRGEQHQRG